MTAKKSALKWEAPPEGRKRYDWDSIAAELRKRPGEWAKVFDEDRTSLATAIRISGINALLPSKGFEVRTANNKRETETQPRLCTLYLRYNPENDRERK